MQKTRGLLWFLRSNMHASSIPNVSKGCILYIAEGGILELGHNCIFDRYVEIAVYPGAKLTIGDYCYFGHGSVVACAESITIGSETMVGDLVSIRDMNHYRVPGVAIRKTGIETLPIVIGKNCWLGSKATLVAGCGIADDVTVGANTVVTNHFKSGITIAGVPAKVITSRKEKRSE